MIDISALEIVDSFIGRMLNNIAAMSRVLDAVTVVVGHAARRWRSPWSSSGWRSPASRRRSMSTRGSP